MEYHQTKHNRQKDKGKEPVEAQSCEKTEDKMAVGNPHTSVITVSANELNSPVKSHRVTVYIKNPQT